MTNICQAIEEELMAIQFAEDNGVDIYKQQNSGMSLALWREILSNPETMRIETSEKFARTSVELTEDIDAEDFAKNYMIESPVILYIPDFDNSDTRGDGVFVLHWLERDFELNGEIGSSWVCLKIKKSFDELIKRDLRPRSLEDICDNSFVEGCLKNGASKDDIKTLQEFYSLLYIALASVIYMMRKPNFVTQTTVSNSGGVRKRLEKKKGIPKERWSRIQWNVGQNVQREVRETMGEEHCTALHRVRGFYRKAKSHYNNVTKIEGEWFQWIEPFWRGHPAFGIVKSTYAPKIEDIKLQ